MVKGLMTIITVAAVSLSLIFTGGCESDAQTGTLVGSGIGAGIGALAGRDTKSTLIGAGIGAGAGYMLGNEADKQKAAAEREALRREIDTITVNITNSNGSITSVKLTKQGVGYVGPRGEYYNTLPTEEQLKQAGYGL